jgi:hypothetical protein
MEPKLDQVVERLLQICHKLEEPGMQRGPALLKHLV